MANIKIKDKNGNWITIASGNANGIATSNSNESVEDVLTEHSNKIAKLERNVSWLALHGGGGAGGGGGSSTSDATCIILANNKESGETIILDDNGLSIKLIDITSSAIKNWSIQVNVGGFLVYTGTASYVSPILYINKEVISSKLINHKANITITASYDDEENGLYGVSHWEGIIIESIIKLYTDNKAINVSDGQTVKPTDFITYEYSVGLFGNYIFEIKLTRGDISKTYTKNISIVGDNEGTIDVILLDLYDEYSVGVYYLTATLYSATDVNLRATITTSLTFISNTVLITSNTMSEDINNPTLVSTNSSIVVKWTAYLQATDSFRYKYYIITNGVEYAINEDYNIGYFGNEIIDYISTVNKEWCIVNETSQLKVVITVGTDTVSHIWYIKYIQSTDSFLPERSVIKPATIINFLAREYNDNIQDFNFINTEYNYNNERHTISADLNIINKNNRVGIKSQGAAPNLRLSNDSFAILHNFIRDNSTPVSIASILGKTFTISISFKADYHPDDNRVIFSYGRYENETKQLLRGIEIDVHNIYIHGESVIPIIDNVLNNIDIVCVSVKEPFIDEYGQSLTAEYHVIKIYIDGALSAVRKYSGAIDTDTYNSEIYIGGKRHNNEYLWLCDTNIYGLQIYNRELNDYDITIKNINNKVGFTYNNGSFDYDIITKELRNNFCERTSDGGVISHLFDVNTENYTINFLVKTNAQGKYELNLENLTTYASSLGIPIMLIDVSSNSSWTFDNFISQQSVELNQVVKAEGIRIQYYDPTQSNNSIITIDDTSVELQGTSTLADSVKNIDITLNNETLFIPKSTWLPEQTYTLKADVVDSSHSNNPAIGRFINEVLNDYYPIDSKAISNVQESSANLGYNVQFKHTVEGFPILLIMSFYKATTSPDEITITPLGLYNFNLGRKAYRNMGFTKIQSVKVGDEVVNLSNATFPYINNEVTIIETNADNAAWIEIKDTASIADMEKVTESGYPANFNSSTGDFWQTDKEIINKKYEVRFPNGATAYSVNAVAGSDKGVFANFVEEIAKLPVEGLRITKSANVAEPNGIVQNDISTQYKKYTYDNGYVETTEYQHIETDPNALVTTTEDSTFNIECAYKYFIIASLFGLIDNFGKNSVLKIYSRMFYLGFYDLDSALGGDNQGGLTIDPSVWIKYIGNKLVTDKPYGYLVETFKKELADNYSKTVYSANHNKLWLSIDSNLIRRKYGVDINNSIYSTTWNELRELLAAKAAEAGYVDSNGNGDFIEFFMNEYYLKQTGDCGSIVFNLDYKLKYLLQFKNNDYTIPKDLIKLHGRKIAYTKNWLRNRLLFLDSLFIWKNNTIQCNFPTDAKSKMNNKIYKTLDYIPVISNADIIISHAVGNLTNTYYFIPKGKKIYLNAGNNSSDSVILWNLSNCPQIIQIGDDEVKLSDMNIYNIGNSSNPKYITSEGLTSITELDLSNNSTFDTTFPLNTFIPSIGNSEIRKIDMSNTKAKLVNGQQPSFSLQLTTQIEGGQIVSKFNKLTSINISGSECISDILLPNVPLKYINIANSSIQNIKLNNQNLIEHLDLSGCYKLSTIEISECAIYDSFNIDGLQNVTEIKLSNNPMLREVIINNCINLRKVSITNNDSLTKIYINKCPNIKGTSSDSYLTIMDNKNLIEIDLNNNGNLEIISIINSNQANITKLDLSKSKVHVIKSTIQDTSNTDILNLKPFTYGTGIKLENNTGIIKVQFLNDKNKPIIVDTTFQGCSNLERVYGCIALSCVTVGSSGAYGMFRNCSKFTIHGDDEEENKALGVKIWNGKFTRRTDGIKTLFEIITDNEDDRIVDEKTGIITHPYRNTSWEDSFVSGDKVTNFKLEFTSQDTAASALFYGTSCTEFDIIYYMYIYYHYIKSKNGWVYTLSYTFYNLTRTSEQKYPFEDNTFDIYGLPRFLFYYYKLYMYHGISSTTINLKPCRSRTLNYDNDISKCNNGVFSNIYYINGYYGIIVDNKVFSCGQDSNGNELINNKFSYIEHFDVRNVVPHTENDDWLNINNYNEYITNPEKVKLLGNFTGLFGINYSDNLGTIFRSFNCEYIDYSTITLHKSLRVCLHSFNTTKGGRGEINIKRITANSINLEEIDNSFNTINNEAYYTDEAGASEFPITSDMFAHLPKLKSVGYSHARSYSLPELYSFKNSRHYIAQDYFPYDILQNNPDIEDFASVFRNCEFKQFAEEIKLPHTMFHNKAKLYSVNGCFADFKIPYTLTPNGFKDSPNLNNVAKLFYSSPSSVDNNRSKLTGEVPARLLYHGKNEITKTIYGFNSEEQPTWEVTDFEDTTQVLVHTNTGYVHNNSIKDASYIFYGDVNIEYYTNNDNQDLREVNLDYCPYKWIYDINTKTWSENTETKARIGYWGFTGDVIDVNDINSPNNIENSDCKYIDIDNVSKLLDKGDNDVRDHVLNFITAPDIFRYCAADCKLAYAFAHCGLNYSASSIYNGTIGSGETYTTKGITGRIPSYLFKQVTNTTDISGIFKFCRRISGYIEDSAIYIIPKQLFNYTPNINVLLEAFQGIDIPYGANLSVFIPLKKNLDIRNIFNLCRYFSKDNSKHTISNVFYNNNIIKLTGAFTSYYLVLQGDYNGNIGNIPVQISNSGKVLFNNNFNAGKLSVTQANIRYVYKGYTYQTEANDNAIPNTNNNYN